MMGGGSGRGTGECKVDARCSASISSVERLHAVDPDDHAGLLVAMDVDRHPWVRIWARLKAAELELAGKGRPPGNPV